MENFNDELAELLEVDAVQDSDVLNSFDAWDSLTVLSIIAHLDESYRVRVSAQELNEADTIEGLKKLVLTKQSQSA